MRMMGKIKGTRSKEHEERGGEVAPPSCALENFDACPWVLLFLFNPLFFELTTWTKRPRYNALNSGRPTCNPMSRLVLIHPRVQGVCLSLACTSLPWSGLSSHRRRSRCSFECLPPYDSRRPQRASVLDTIYLRNPRDLIASQATTTATFSLVQQLVNMRCLPPFDPFRMSLREARFGLRVVSGYTRCTRLIQRVREKWGTSRPRWHPRDPKSKRKVGDEPPALAPPRSEI
jgi:hypothetical protein